MSGPVVTVGYGAAYPEAVIDQLAEELAQCGLPSRLELLGPDARLVVDLPMDDALLSEPVTALWDAVVATAQRRHRRQLAEGQPREVTVTLRLPGDVAVVATPDTSADQTRPLMTALTERRAAGTLGPGTWHWHGGTGLRRTG
jgi:hypothetical protein